MDGFASVQVKGGLDGVPTGAAIQGGLKALAVTTAGKLAVAGEGATGRNTDVVIPSTSENLYASIIL